MHVVAPLNNRARATSTDGSIVVHHAGQSELFGWPGAIANVKTNPLGLWRVALFAHVTRRLISQIQNVDHVIGHWIIPAGMPLLWDHPAPLEVVAHGADVRLLMAMPQALRVQIMRRLVDRETKFRFVARASLQTIETSLPSLLAGRLVQASYVEPAAIELPDVAARAAEIRRLMDDVGGPFVVAVGRLIELKRFDVAIRSASRAGVPMVILGDGPLRGHLEQVAANSRVPVLFKGQLDRRETLAWIAASSLLVHPSRAEAAPTVVREARALGVPVVVSAVGDVALWAETDLGIVVVDSDEEALVLAIKTAFSAHFARHSNDVR